MFQKNEKPVMIISSIHKTWIIQVIKVSRHEMLLGPRDEAKEVAVLLWLSKCSQASSSSDSVHINLSDEKTCRHLKLLKVSGSRWIVPCEFVTSTAGIPDIVILFVKILMVLQLYPDFNPGGYIGQSVKNDPQIQLFVKFY